MKKVLLPLIIAFTFLLLGAFLTSSSIDTKLTAKEYATVEVFSFSGGTKFTGAIIAYPDGKTETVDIGKGRGLMGKVDEHTETIANVNAVLNKMSAKGYTLVSATTTGVISTYTFKNLIPKPTSNSVNSI